MNRIDQLFSEKKGNILSIYFTAGFPHRDDTRSVLRSLETAGADLVEIGIPFSDPIADGPTIQESNQKALDNGMHLALLLDQLESVRTEVKIPLILMGYINPIIQYGIERFCQRCQQIGIDALILPDLPLYEYEQEYKALFEEYGLYNIFLITPQTSEERIRKIDQVSDGFIYMVSSASVTGAKNEVSDTQINYFRRIEAMNLKHPTLIGFGISNHETFKRACNHASGAIIGSAFIRLLAEKGSDVEIITQFLKEIKEG